jgi:glyoxylase-like metal-dependent hydrolase (beta-lactamase superfamily II)
VEIRNLGAGHTVGDLVVSIPEEKVLISGDLVAYPVPYFFAGWPYELIRTLETIEAMDLRAIVPGHGPVLHDKQYVGRMLDLLKQTRDQVVQEVRRRGSLSAKHEDVRKAIDFSAAEKRFAGDDADNLEYFRESMDGLVEGLFYQIEL